jgi:hypothetical protein
VRPQDFVRARSALAAKLEKQGKAAAAKEVRRLRRPSPVIWALNNSMARAPRVVQDLADAVSQLRRAQLGQGELRPAMERFRAAIGPLVRGAAAKLRDTDTRVSPAVERRLHDTLLAAVADRRLRADLMAGRLTEEREAAGFDVLTKGPIPAARRRAPFAKEERKAKTAGAAKAERRRQRAAEREARQAARQAQRAAKARDAVARRTEHAAAAAEAKVGAMRAALLEEERRAAQLRRAATEARDATRGITPPATR